MGNAAICRGKGDIVEFTTVLRGNGTVLTFYSPMRVADLLQEYPGHFVCHSSSLLLTHEGKILAADMILTPGETYFLLPLPRNRTSDAGTIGDKDDLQATISTCFSQRGDKGTVSNTPQQQQQQQGCSGTMKFAVSNEMFSSILSGSMREENLSKSRRHSKESTPFLGRVKSSWDPRLSARVAEVVTTKSSALM
ncbi:hypothetical protein BDL97_10G059000 [Sphagnum fallax]|jgi:hypothetical protein|nr:hypothetical protein BDL97_10G059000 [Sphagnum fallax]KAH8949948.1 hypothetical protein BDL97_10G059000 [Sphagnum fallax]KAH8949949.1 hypothetical protein BDL97_10G059000 [Sphagnum fallax]